MVILQSSPELKAFQSNSLQQIGFCHMRVGDGVNSRLQLSGLLAELCKLTLRASA